MADPRINVEITGKDRGVQAMLDRARQQLAGFGKSTEKTQKQLESMGRRNGLDRLGKGLEGATRGSFNLFKNISRIVDPLSIITGAGTLAGLAALEAKFASFGQANVNSARGLNMSVDQLTRWQFAAKRAGVSSEEMTSNIGGLEKAVAAMRVENSPANGIANQLLGAGWQQKYKSDTDLLVAISGRISNLHGNAKALAMEQVGSGFGLDQNVVGMLTRGPQWLQHSLQLAQQHGAMTGGQANALDQLKQSLTDVGESIEGVANGVTSAFAPALAKGATELSRWIDKHRGEIVHDVQAFVKDIGAALNKIPWDSILTKGKALFDAFGQFANMKVAAGGALALLLSAKMAGIALPFQALSAAFGALSGSGAGSFAALGRALRLAGFAMIGGQIVQAGVDAAGGGKGLASVAGDAASGAMLGSYFGLPGAAIGATLGAAYGGYEVHKENKAAIAARAQDMVTYYRSQGLSAVQAAGLVGGFEQESSLDPTAHNDQDGGHYGIGQWDTARQADFAKIFGHTMQKGTLQEQMAFALDEMFNGKEGSAGARLRAAKTGAEATDAALYFERPANPGTPAWQNEYTARLANTAEILSGMTDGAKYLPNVDDAGNAGPWPVDTKAAQPLGGNSGPIYTPPREPDGGDRHVVELHVSAPAGSTVTARQTGGNTTVKTVTAMPSHAS